MLILAIRKFESPTFSYWCDGLISYDRHYSASVTHNMTLFPTKTRTFFFVTTTTNINGLYANNASSAFYEYSKLPSYNISWGVWRIRILGQYFSYYLNLQFSQTWARVSLKLAHVTHSRWSHYFHGINSILCAIRSGKGHWSSADYSLPIFITRFDKRLSGNESSQNQRSCLISSLGFPLFAITEGNC